ncbi:MAG TPA: efflux RND transporter periplasmic adaptor subunit [Vicinamibacterales bacterium]|nr:efflux RND transporter periplasmic adaptor subunit [Vicinamibacterales bacterium]
MVRPALVAALAVAAGCGGGGQQGEAAGGPGGRGGRGGGGVPVEVATLAAKPIEQTGEFVGTIKSRKATTIQPQAEGFLQKILVKSGDRVAPGTPMFEIDAAMQQAAVASMESIRTARESDLALAQQQEKRAKSLLEVGAMSQQEYEQASAQLRSAQANLNAVNEQIKQQRTELNYFRVVAPTAGIVGDVPVRQGDRVTRTTVLTTIDDNSALEVYIQVPVQQAPRLKIGLPVRIVDETGATIASERINFISPSVDDSTQTVLVKTPLTPKGSTFRTEQFVRAHIVFSTEPGLTVPVVALSRINGQFFAFVAEPGEGGATVAKQKSVQVGPVIGNDYVLLSGLKAGDKLIVSGIQKIGDGAPVTPMPAASAPKPGTGEGAAPAAGAGS